MISVVYFRLPVVWSEGAQSGQLYVVLLLLAVPSLSADRAKPTALHQQSSSSSVDSQLAYKWTDNWTHVAVSWSKAVFPPVAAVHQITDILTTNEYHTCQTIRMVNMTSWPDRSVTTAGRWFWDVGLVGSVCLALSCCYWWVGITDLPNEYRQSALSPLVAPDTKRQTGGSTAVAGGEDLGCK